MSCLSIRPVSRKSGLSTSLSHSLTLLKLLLSSWSVVTRQRSFSAWVISHWHKSSAYPTAGCSPRALPGWLPQPQWVWSSQRSCLSALWTPLPPDRADRASETRLPAPGDQELPPKLPGYAPIAVEPCFPTLLVSLLVASTAYKFLFHRCRALPPLPLASPGFCHPKPCDLWASSSSPISS